MWDFLACFGLVPMAMVLAGIFWLRKLQHRLKSQSDEIAQLRESVARLRFEFRQRTRDPATATPPVADPQPKPEPLELPEEPEEAPPAPPTPPAPPRAPKQPPPTPPPARPALKINWEQWIGVRGAAVAGAVVAALAGILFLKYSIEKGLLPPVVRVTMGYLSGTAILMLAQWVRRNRYKPTADALAGAGVVILYAATWAGRSLYDLLSLPLAFGLMILVTLAGGLLAWRYRAMSTAYIGIIGGFATPLLLTSDLLNPIGLFGYLLLLNIGVWVLARRNRWYGLAFVAQGATFLYQATWIGLKMDQSRPLVGLIILALFAVFFTLVAQRGQNLRLQISGLLAPFTVGFYYAAHSDLTRDPLGFVALIALVSVLACWLSIAQGRPLIALSAVAADLALVVVWSSNSGLDVSRSWQLGGISIVLALLFHLRHEWVASRAGSGPGEHTTSGPETLPSLLAAGGLLSWNSVLLVVDAKVGFTAWLISAIILGAMLLRQSRISAEGYQPMIAAVAIAGGFIGPVGRFALAPELLNPGTPGAVVLYLIVIALGTAFLAWGLWKDDRSPGRGFGTMAATVLCSIVLSVALGDRGLSASSFFAVTAVLALLVVLAATRLSSGGLYAVAGVLLLVNHMAWISDAGSPPANAGIALAAMALAVIFFSFWPWFTRATWLAADSIPKSPRRLFSIPELSSGRVVWIAAALTGPAWFMGLRDLWLHLFGDSAIGLLPLGLGLVAFLAAWAATQSPQTRLALVWFSAVALGAISLAIPLQLEKEWVTVGWSLNAFAMLLLWRRMRYPGLAWFGLALHVAVVSRLLLNPAVLDYHPASGMPVLNWIAYTYLIPAASLIASGVILTRGAEDDADSNVDRWKKVAQGLGGAAILVVFAWINLTVWDAFAEGSRLTFDFQHRPARDLTLSISWAVYALALLGLGLVRRVAALRWVSLVFLVLTILKVFLHDLGELTDLYRVASLVGLAVSLIAVSLLYQRFVFVNHPTHGTRGDS